MARYQEPSLWRASWQIINTLGPYVLLWYLMYRSLAVSYWLTLPMAALAGALSVWWMNIAILGMAATLSWVFGIAPYLLIQSTVLMVAGAAGVWLFYVQHQFEDAYWERREDWDYTTAALQVGKDGSGDRNGSADSAG